MAITIYLTPVTSFPADITQLSLDCKAQLLALLYVRIVGEDLRPDSTNKIFTSKHPDWIQTRKPRVSTVNALGVETLKFENIDYTISYAGGTVTFPNAVTDTVRVDYYYFPFTDQQIVTFGLFALQELSLLIYRPINPSLIHADYAVTIVKRLYTLVVKALLLEARDYFSVSVGGRSINKTNVVAQLNAIINQNEEQVLAEVNVLRTFNKTNRLLPSFTSTSAIKSVAQIT